MCKGTYTTVRCNHTDWAIGRWAHVHEPCSDALFLEWTQFAAIEAKCGIGEDPLFIVHHSFERNDTANPDRCYHDLHAKTLCVCTEQCHRRRQVMLKHMWGYSDCQKPKREDLNVTFAWSGVASSRVGLVFKMGYLTTAVLTVAVVAVMEVVKEWR